MKQSAASKMEAKRKYQSRSTSPSLLTKWPNKSWWLLDTNIFKLSCFGALFFLPCLSLRQLYRQPGDRFRLQSAAECCQRRTGRRISLPVVSSKVVNSLCINLLGAPSCITQRLWSPHDEIVCIISVLAAGLPGRCSSALRSNRR